MAIDLLTSNRIKTTIADVGGISAVALSMTVASAATIPAIGAGKFCILKITNVTTLAYEYVKATAIAGSVLTIERAQEGTTALAFAQGARVDGVITKGMIEAIIAYLEAFSASYGADIATAIATANNATTLASAALAAVTAKFPVGTVDIQAEAITAALIAAAAIQAPLTGGAGTPIGLNYDTSMFEVVGGILKLKDSGITVAKINGQLLTQFQQYFITATGTGVFYTGAPGPGTPLFGNSGVGMRHVCLSLTNDHLTQEAHIQVRIGGLLDFYLGTGSDQGDDLFDFWIEDAGWRPSGKDYHNITIPVPPGHKWMLWHVNAGTGTPNLLRHKCVELK